MSQFQGQLNLPDMFTRLVLILDLTGIAPQSFYERNADAGHARMHYDGMPVFPRRGYPADWFPPWNGHKTYNTIFTHLDDGISLDTIADWIESTGHSL